MTTSVDGLVSGLSTSDLITQLMAIEKQPQQSLIASRDKVQKVVSAYQSLNTRVSTVRDAAKTLADPKTWQLAAATSSDSTRVVAQATTGATVGSLTFSVERLAAAGSAITSGTTGSTGDVVTSLKTISVTKGTTTTSVGVGTGTLADVITGINGANIGVTATAVQVSPGAYKLQLMSTTTGAATDVSVSDGTGGDPFATATLGTLGKLTCGADAQLRVAGVGGIGGYLVTRPSNTISDLLGGVTLTLTKADPATSVSVDVATDTGGIADTVGKLVDAVNATLSEIRTDTAYNTSTDTSSVLTGDPMLAGLQQRLIGAATQGVAGNAIGSPGLVGVSVQRDGTLSFDRTKFLDQLAKNPSAVAGLLGAGTTTTPGMAARLQAVGDSAVASGTGQISTAIQGGQDRVRDLTIRSTTGTCACPTGRTRSSGSSPPWRSHSGSSASRAPGWPARSPAWLARRDRAAAAVVAPGHNSQQGKDRFDAHRAGRKAYRDRYVADSVATASPARLLTMLYDALTRDLVLAEQGLADRDLATVNSRLLHAQDIVRELQSSLQPASWSGGPALDQLYTFLLEQLVRANVTKEAAAIVACRAIVEPLREAWHQAAAAAAAGPGS